MQAPIENGHVVLTCQDYLSCWLAKCKQKPTTLTPRRKFWPSIAGMVFGNSSTGTIGQKAWLL